MVDEKELEKDSNDTDENVEAAAEDTVAKEEAEEVVSEEATEESEEKKSIFKKKKDKKDEMIEELTDKYKRTFAEFDNFRKRSEKEKSAMYEIGARDVVEKILPIVDNFERGFASVSDEEKATPFASGMDMIYKQLMKTLEDMGVKEIEALGKEFDPNIHNAVMHIDDENLGDNEVAEVLLKGYMYKDTVVRHSMVKVAN
ncbi:MAG: nucleotide exchange factor GrpE [Lachnospiraceae bacterium]|nr:nucleotide exchange factor GrpE [Lachnospiraceae bacterium]